MRYNTLAPERYSPLYYLSSVGAGGLAVSFFMYLLWLTPHPDQPIPSYSTLSAAFFKGNPAMQALIIASLLAILFFGFLHFRLLAWNAKHDSAWRETDAFKAFQSGNAESQLMALPLTLAMSVNVLFIAGALFVPGLWEQAELLFTLAVAAFAAIGYLALKTFASFMARVLTKGGFDCAKNNGLGQMLPVFTFAMVAVGFSATVAMSHTKWLVVIAYLGAAFFLMATLVFGAVFLVLGFRAMMEHKIAEENAATLWILIPILTVVGIALYRMNKGLEHNFGIEWHAAGPFTLFAFIFGLQLVFAIFGRSVLKANGYLDKYLHGDARSPGSYALVCPGVALFVMGTFLLNPGLLGIGIVGKFSWAYFALFAALAAIQFVTVASYMKLNRKLLSFEPQSGARIAPAE